MPCMCFSWHCFLFSHLNCRLLEICCLLDLDMNLELLFISSNCSCIRNTRRPRDCTKKILDVVNDFPRCFPPQLTHAQRRKTRRESLWRMLVLVFRHGIEAFDGTVSWHVKLLCIGLQSDTLQHGASAMGRQHLFIFPKMRSKCACAKSARTPGSSIG